MHDVCVHYINHLLSILILSYLPFVYAFLCYLK